MFKKLWNSFSSSRTLKIVAPISGSILPIEQVDDPVFSQKMMGDGLAILPSDGKVIAPFTGKIAVTFPTGHAVAIQSSEGIECLIHVGLDTVALNGNGFQSYITVGQHVQQGDILMEVDLSLIHQSGKSPVTPIIITNGDKWTMSDQKKGGDVVAGRDTIFDVTPA